MSNVERCIPFLSTAQRLCVSIDRLKSASLWTPEVSLAKILTVTYTSTADNGSTDIPRTSASVSAALAPRFLNSLLVT
ncbi:hypothetical protein CEXT_582911 [Caerostris extrusa]|uniref:Uncharacterized protein n=1 Tax=Caerostris extrusa TaxID=172846 RepID=A0AAV4RNU2_CAEEX|nr:hypothetical protein CEXT_582911 [Caerostris extrusa]